MSDRILCCVTATGSASGRTIGAAGLIAAMVGARTRGAGTCHGSFRRSRGAYLLCSRRRPEPAWELSLDSADRVRWGLALARLRRTSWRVVFGLDHLMAAACAAMASRLERASGDAVKQAWRCAEERQTGGIVDTCAAREHPRRCRHAGVRNTLSRVTATALAEACQGAGTRRRVSTSPSACSRAQQQKEFWRAAGDRAAAADPRRADPRHRRRGQAGNHG